MSFDILLENVLKNITFNDEIVPFSKLEYSGDSRSYMTYYTYLTTPFGSDDKQWIYSTVSATVDIFTDNENFTELADMVIAKLITAEFEITDTGPEMYETDTGLYHIPISIKKIMK